MAPPRATAYAPGSTSNLGPGFDCLGIALLGLGDRVTATVTAAGAGGGAPVVVASVSDARIPREAERNTAAIAARAVLRLAGRSEALQLSIEKGLPLAGGMGGSAASAVAGAVAADAVLGADLSWEALLEAALEAEAAVAGRHLDNVAPSLLGGAVLVIGQDPPRFVRARVHPDLRLVLATPAYGVETAAARAVLPGEVSRGDAVAQAASLAGLLLGLERGDGEVVAACLRDRIAEPARAPLYPGSAEAREAARAAGALGVAVSGAGPTLVAVAPVSAAPAVARALVDAYERAGFRAVAQEAGVDEQGARVTARG